MNQWGPSLSQWGHLNWIRGAICLVNGPRGALWWPVWPSDVSMWPSYESVGPFQLSIISNIYLVDHFSIGHVPCSGSVGPSGGSLGHSGESVGSSGGSVGPSCVSLGLIH